MGRRVLVGNGGLGGGVVGMQVPPLYVASRIDH